MTSRRDFLKKGSAAVAATVLVTPEQVKAYEEQPVKVIDEPGKVTLIPFKCPRCGSKRSRPVAIKIVTDGSDEKRLYGSKALTVRYVEGCGDCRDVGVRIL
jgi:anaerobic selenocysteine-containing dehydrogenase